MLKLVDAVGIAPDVIEPIDDDEQPPPFRGQGIGYPCQVLPKVCGLARYDARHVRCLGRYLVEERIGDVEEGGAIRRGFAKRQEIVMADHQSVRGEDRSEEHTSELQSLMRISYAVFCLTKTKPLTQSTLHNTKTK